MSDDKYYQRLESLFSGTEHVPPDPDQPARPPEAPDAEALQARLAELEAAADEARRQAEQERTQRAAAAAEAENLRAKMAELEAASAQPQPTTTDNLAGQVDAGVAEEVTSQTEMPAASSEARPTGGRRSTLFAIPALRPHPAEEEKSTARAHNALRVALILLGALVVLDLYSIYSARSLSPSLTAPQWVSVGLSFALTTLALVSTWLILRKRVSLGVWLMITGAWVALLLASLLGAGSGLVYAATGVVITSVIAGQGLPSQQSGRAILIGVLLGIVIAGLDLYRPANSPAAGSPVFTFAVLGGLLLIFALIIARQFPHYTLRTKIVLGVLLTTALSLAALTYVTYSRTQRSQTFLTGQLQTAVSQQAEQQLNNTVLAEARTADQTLSIVTEDVVALADYRASLYAQAATLEQGAYWDAHTRVTQLATGQYGNPAADVAAVFIPSTVPFDQAMIADLNGSAYLDFVGPAILKAHPNIVALYFINARGATTYYPNIGLAAVVPPDFDPRTQPFYDVATPQNDPERKPVWTAPYQDPAGNGLMVTNATPVYDQAGQFRGVLAADVQLAKISEQVSAVKIGQTGYAFLIDPAGRIIAMPEAGYQAFGLQPEAVPVNETPKETVLGKGPTDFQTITFRMAAGETGLKTAFVDGVEYYVAYAPLPSTGYSLGVVVPGAELNVPYQAARDQIQVETQTTVRLAGIVLIVVLLLATGVSLGIGQFIAAPLAQLTETAQRITAGDLSLQARVTTDDEAGLLARAFNAMTARLHETLHGLEERVADRTRDLALAAEVGQRISVVRDLDALLAEAVETIRARFDLYYTQIYLTNSSGMTLLLRAGTGAVGQELLRRSHRLPIGPGSINGAAAAGQRPVLASDTAASGLFRPNPLLPDTRSEVSVPLLAGDRVVGVLDLQSVQPGAFTPDNLSAFQALAGQLAIAIENAHLFAETAQAREEMQDQARRLTHDSWQEFLNAVDRSEHLGYAYDQVDLTPLAEPFSSEDEHILSVPLVVTGETVGALHLEAEAERTWTEAEVELVSSVAHQVAQQVEHLRLLADAERARAEAEQATHRLTRESWQDYLERDTSSAQGYVYDLNQVAPLTPVTQGETTLALTWPLKVQDETIGELAVGELPEKLSDETVELITVVSQQLSAHIENLRLTEQTARALAQTEQQAAELRALFAAMPDVVLVYDEAGRYVKIAPTNPSLLYKPPSEMLGKTVAEVLPAPQAEAILSHIQHVLDTREMHNIEYPLTIGDREVWFSASVVPLTANTVFWIARDISARKQAEEEILKFKLGIERSTDAVFVADPHGTIVYANPAFEEVYGYRPEEAIGQTPRILKSGLVPQEAYKQFWATLLNKGVVAGEIVNKTKDGRLITIEASNNPIVDEAGNIVGFLGVHRDITERKRTEAVVAKRATELQTVAKVSTAASTVLEARILLQNVVDLTKGSFALYHTHIYLIDEPTGMLVLAAGAGEVGRRMVSEGRSIPLNRAQSLVARAAREREAVIVNDVQAAPDFLPHPLLPDTRSEMAIPMIVGDQLLGVFDVQHDQPGYFTEEDVRIQTTLAAQVAVALQNANLYADQAAIVTRLREMDHLKSTFLANMSHELRTPLNSILGFTDVMLEGLDGPLTDLMEGDLKVVQKNGKHLLNLINDVLDMAKIEAGKMSLSLERFNLQEVLEEVVDLTSPLAREKALDLRVVAGPAEALSLTADRIRLRQVMINLVGNAIKFTEQGSITLQAVRQNGNVHVAIRDTGLGIPPEKLETIFEAFSQVDTSTTRRAGGTGLGLPISRRLIEMHGGRLWAESTGVSGEGSTFCVELPIEVPAVVA